MAAFDIQQDFDLLLDTAGSIPRLRELILQLAVMGKLVPQDPHDEPASILLAKIRVEKEKLVAEGKIKKPKALPSIAEGDLPFVLPVNWEWVRLGDIRSKTGAGSTPLGGRQVYVSNGIAFLRSQNVWNQGLQLNGVARIPRKIHEKMNGTHLEPGDLLLNITGASIARCAIAPDNVIPANVSQHVAIIRLYLKSIGPFAHITLISPYIYNTIMGVQVGISREGLSMGRLRQFVIPLPPLAEQKRIVARVDALMSLCDQYEERTKRVARTRESLCKAALSGLTESATPKEF